MLWPSLATMRMFTSLHATDERASMIRDHAPVYVRGLCVYTARTMCHYLLPRAGPRMQVQCWSRCVLPFIQLNWCMCGDNACCTV